jgi:Reverse transcriptase (RNA-dependent DNA polymerase)/RNase H-like domain found in reverse transcriptase/gag-polyprotein putative aspartyl protease
MQHYQPFQLLTEVSRAPEKRQPVPQQRIFLHTILSILSYSVASLNPFQRTSKRPYVQGKLGNLPFSALFDTGADISCLSEQLFRKIPVSVRPTKLEMAPSSQFKSAGGQSLDVKGKYSIPIQLQGKQVQHEFYVIRNLNEPLILGIDFITHHKLQFCPQSRDFFWQDDAQWRKGSLQSAHSMKLAPLTSTPIQVNLITDTMCRPTQDSPCVAHISAPDLPLLSGGPGLIRIDKQGSACLQIQNCAPYEVEIPRGTVIGTFENVQNCDIQQLNPKYINSVADEIQKTKPNPPLTPEKKTFILDNVTLNVPDEEKDSYLKVLFDNHAVFSENKHDLGRATTLQHEITLKTKEPIYIKQFKIPEAHQQEVENYVKEWLKLGVIQPSRSKYNSPVFVVAKKDGGLRIVQDFRALNAQSHIDKYSMKDVQECVGEIGRSGSTIFSTIDLTSGFWQMLLEPASRPYTAFTVPGMGQFEWVTSPMGLLGCPASFQRLVEAVVAGLANIIVYIDDLLVHSKTHQQHRIQLQQLFQRLQAHGLKINLKKCVFGSKDVLYLGFRLTQEGIKPGQCKLKAVAQTKPPVSVHEVRQFLGLCNFFRTHVKNFAQISAPLCRLTQKDSKWKTGPMPDDALKSFRTLQSILVSEPVMDYPRPDRQYALITDAALGDDAHPGGLGAILTQIDEQRNYKVIAYASRKLLKHEKTTPRFSWKCKPPSGLWITSTPI